ncbi:MaoC family dehydratase [Halobellus rufus]|uniref:MaoC family dehydratase n=1 Tax=Halobellus rufus TaxID=1448860 RepID=UPI000679D0A1|nr:MaoC family dehydratase [Halobellus rufus]
MQYYEDVEVGSTATFGEYEVTAEEIKSFAETYDPQPFHTDEEAAAESMFGGLVASGWHTMAMCMRLTAERPDALAALAGVAADNLRWVNPVRPGDRLSLRTEVIEKRPSSSHEDRGYVTTHVEAVNQDGETVVRFDATALVKRRSYDDQ